MKGLRNDAYWKLAKFCALDVETTGLDLLNDEIISIGAVQIIEGRIVQSFDFYREVKPGIPPSVESIQIHGLRAVDLEGATTVTAAISDLLPLLQDRVLIAHAAWVEKAFLTPHLSEVGTAFPKKVIDTAALARACGYGDQLFSHELSLEYLARQLNLPAYAPHHALGDALTTAVVFLALASELERKIFVDSEKELTLSRLLKISSNHSHLKALHPFSGRRMGVIGRKVT